MYEVETTSSIDSYTDEQIENAKKEWAEMDDDTRNKLIALMKQALEHAQANM